MSENPGRGPQDIGIWLVMCLLTCVLRACLLLTVPNRLLSFVAFGCVFVVLWASEEKKVREMPRWHGRWASFSLFF